MPVDMLSFHVDQYLPVTLSNPVMPCPVYGMPIMALLNCSTRTRPSSAIERVAVPVSSIGGPSGWCQCRIFTS